MIKAGTEELREQLKDLEEKWKRALADYANLERRIAKEKKEFVRFSNAGLIKKLLKVLDDLEICSRHLKDEGLTIVIRQFQNVLESEGLEKIDALGKDFDPGLMEVVEAVEGPKNKVKEVVANGYRLNGEVLRPAKVKVGTGKIDERKKEEAEKMEKET